MEGVYSVPTHNDSTDTGEPQLPLIYSEKLKEVVQCLPEEMEKWVPESQWEGSKASKVCRACGGKFGLLNRRHNCFGCGKLHCAGCLPWIIRRPNIGKCVLCDICFKQCTKRDDSLQFQGSALFQEAGKSGALSSDKAAEANARLASRPGTSPRSPSPRPAAGNGVHYSGF